jgi:hypothetical protein
MHEGFVSLKYSISLKRGPTYSSRFLNFFLRLSPIHKYLYAHEHVLLEFKHMGITSTWHNKFFERLPESTWKIPFCDELINFNAVEHFNRACRRTEWNKASRKQVWLWGNCRQPEHTVKTVHTNEKKIPPPYSLFLFHIYVSGFYTHSIHRRWALFFLASHYRFGTSYFLITRSELIMVHNYVLHLEHSTLAYLYEKLIHKPCALTKLMKYILHKRYENELTGTSLISFFIFLVLPQDRLSYNRYQLQSAEN